jgi:hypothetical protein
MLSSERRSSPPGGERDALIDGLRLSKCLYDLLQFGNVAYCLL